MSFYGARSAGVSVGAHTVAIDPERNINFHFLISSFPFPVPPFRPTLWPDPDEDGQDHMIHVKMQLTVEKR